MYMKNISTSWDKKYMGLAAHVSSWSKDPSSQVGAVAISPEDNHVLSMGYNGFPKGIEDSEERLNDRDQKYPLTVHAEKNCIYNATYNGVSLKGAFLYVYGRPICDECSLGIIQVGISRVIMPISIISSITENPDNIWSHKFNKSLANFKECDTVDVKLLEGF